MTLAVEDQLRRLADTLREEIGPAVGDEYTRTQAFMTSVILRRLASQVEHGPRHAESERRDVLTLHARLEPILAAESDQVTSAYAAAEAEGTVAALGRLIRQLHAADGAPSRDALDLIRPVLRSDIDRRMEIAT